MNYLAILVCGVAAMIIGSIWYGPLFGKIYMKSMCPEGMSPEQKAAMKKKMGPMYVVQFVLSLISAFVLAKMGPSLTAAFWVWFGFIMPTVASGALWSGKPKAAALSFFSITVLANLVTILVFTWILSMWM